MILRKSGKAFGQEMGMDRGVIEGIPGEDSGQNADSAYLDRATMRVEMGLPADYVSADDGRTGFLLGISQGEAPCFWFGDRGLVLPAGGWEGDAHAPAPPLVKHPRPPNLAARKKNFLYNPPLVNVTGVFSEII
jgi:hypothetical protein